MNAKTEKKRMSKFSIILLSCIGAFLVILLIAARIITVILAEYESVQPVHLAEAVVEEYFKAGDKAPLIELSDYEKSDYTSTEEVCEYLNGIIKADDISFYGISTPYDNMKTFAVSAGGLKVALINIKDSDRLTKHGFTKKELDGVELLIAGTDSIAVKAPKLYSVYLNGKLLTEDCIEGEAEPDINADKIPEGIPTLDYVTYTVDGLFGEPEITAVSEDGTPVSDITRDEDTGLYTVSLADNPVPDDIKALVLDASERYAAYMQNDLGFYQLAPYIDAGADIYQNLLKSEVRWVNDHNGYSIENPEVLEFYMYGDTVFTCRVKFSHILHIYGMDDYVNYFDTTFFFRKSGEDWLIYDSMVN